MKNNPILKAVIGFNKGALTLPKPWQGWMGLMLLANLILPIVYLNTLEAKVVLAGFVVSFILTLYLFSKFGFVKLLGLGHTPWLFTVPWLASRLTEVVPLGPFYYWLLAVVIIDSFSLLIDGADAVHYLKNVKA